MTSNTKPEITAPEEPAIVPVTPSATAPAPAHLSLLARLRATFLDHFGFNVVHEKRSSDDMAAVRTDLATTRTLMAADRTLMAWIRTALSLDSFGFTIYKLLQGFQEAGGGAAQGDTPRNMGLFLTGLGTFAMVMGTVEYWQTLRDLRQMQEFRLMRPSLIMALVMSVIGVFLFFSIITKLF